MKFDRTTPVTVSVRVPAGTVDIAAEDHVAVAAEIRPLDGSDESRRAAEQATVSLDGDTLVVHVPERSGLRRSPAVAVTIRVPTGSSLAARTASADLNATGSYATVHADLASGDAAVDEVTGDAQLKAASGDLTVGRVGGALRIGSSSGELDIGDVTGDVKADTASGDITLRSAGASADVETASGTVRIGMLRRGRARIGTASGDVTAGVAAGTGVWLDVETVSGSTRNDLSMGADTPGATPASTAATLELRIHTVSGDIAIRRVTAPQPATA